jgi:hypothetical protein
MGQSCRLLLSCSHHLINSKVGEHSLKLCGVITMMIMIVIMMMTTSLRNHHNHPYRHCQYCLPMASCNRRRQDMPYCIVESCYTEPTFVTKGSGQSWSELWTLPTGPFDRVSREGPVPFLGRMDVAERRALLQQQSVTMATQKCGGGLERGWSANRSAKVLPKSSCFNRVIPAFDTAINRANPDFQRRSRLEAEDLLLRTILLDEKPESIKKILLSGDVSIL